MFHSMSINSLWVITATSLQVSSLQTPAMECRVPIPRSGSRGQLHFNKPGLTLNPGSQPLKNKSYQEKSMLGWSTTLDPAKATLISPALRSATNRSGGTEEDSHLVSPEVSGAPLVHKQHCPLWIFHQAPALH